MCRKACDAQKTRKTWGKARFVSWNSARAFSVEVRVLISSKGLCSLNRTYRIYNHRAKDSRSHLSSVFGIFGFSHHCVVSACEHASDGAQDDDGEYGDDYASPGIEG